MFLELKEITKTFGQTVANDHISFGLEKGEILAVIGENGAGKSTLMNIVCGVLKPDAGKLYLEGNAYQPQKPSDATKAGIAFIHQELNLFTNLTIAENLFIDEGVEHKRLMRAKEINTKAAKILERLGIRENTKKSGGRTDDGYASDGGNREGSLKKC